MQAQLWIVAVFRAAASSNHGYTRSRPRRRGRDGACCHRSDNQPDLRTALRM